MGRKRASKMVVEKADQSKELGFETDQFSIETNKTLLKNKVMTFSAKVARQIGYTEGNMNLTLVWEGKRMSVSFVRDTHPGGGWRSVKEDFVKFFDVVKFKENQGYSIYQVSGLGQYAFEFEKSWEYFPEGGTVAIPGKRRRWQISNPEVANAEENEAGESSNPPSSKDVILWRRPAAARKSAGTSAGQVKKRKPRMRTGRPGSLQIRKERSKVVYREDPSQLKPKKMVKFAQGEGSGKGEGQEEEEDVIMLKIKKEQDEVGN